MFRSARPPVIRVWLRRVAPASAICLCICWIAGCGGSAGGLPPTRHSRTLPAGLGAPFVAFYCPLTSRALSPAEQALFAHAGVDRGVCAATDATWNVVTHALGRLTPGQQAMLYALAGARSVGASSPLAGAALEITDGVLAGAILRALPVAPATTANATARHGQRQPNPTLTALIGAAVDPASDPPCSPVPKRNLDRSDAGESLVRSATEALVRHERFKGVLLAVAHELANDKFCERLAELIDQLRRAANAATDPGLVDRLVAAQGQLEGRRDLPAAGTRAYADLQKRAIRTYILSGQLTEAEQQSGGEVALAAKLRAVRTDEPRGRGDSAILAEQTHADSMIETEEAP